MRKLDDRHYGAFSNSSKKTTEGLTFHCAKCGLKTVADSEENGDFTEQSSADSIGINRALANS